jgi:hypothetical protein
MDEELIKKAKAYVAGRHLTIGVPLGFGIHGIVLLLIGQREPGSRALKMHHSEEFYLRERAVYERLKTAGVSSICGCEVPRLIRFDDELLALEMTVVSPPFVLDFAGAYLNFPPDFSEAIWTTWEAEKREQFGARWPEVTAILGALRGFGIHMLDISPSNLRFE